MTVKFFGQLLDIVDKDIITVNAVEDTNSLIKNLQEIYPGLTNSKFSIAVNKNIIQNNTSLNQDAEVALLPPFSGG